MRTGLDTRQFSCRDLVLAHVERIEAVEPLVRAFLHRDSRGALAAAEQYDKTFTRRQRTVPEGPSPLAGIPVALKDIICTRDMPTTCGSRLLEGYTPPYDATVTRRLREAGAILMGKTNMDEFAMGSSCENSAYGATHNPLDLDRVPGGSSGGSAAAVAAREVPVSVGTDTGGSVRQPAALCGLVGMKPSYGRVSRYGLVAFASSLDQAGPLAHSVEEARLLLEAIWGPDPLDSTALKIQPPQSRSTSRPLSHFKLGVLRPPPGSGVEAGVEAAYQGALQKLLDSGARLEEVEIPHAEAAIPAYYLVATAEASANLARFDGVRYGNRPDGAVSGLREMYEGIRTRRFGPEVQRRIMLGTFALAAGYYNAYYLKAQKVRTVLRQDFQQLFRQVDLLLTPTSPAVAFPLGEKQADPLAMYLNDVFTVPASLAGLPALSLPCGQAAGLPVGLQVIGARLQDRMVLQAAGAIESTLDLPPFPLQVGV